MSRIVLASLLAATLVPAQCPYSSLGAASYGNGCITVFGAAPTLRGALDTNQCSLGITVDAFTGCCNTFLTARALAIGLQQVSVPVPQIGPNCTLLVDPVALLFLPAQAGDTFVLQLPTIPLPPIALQAQGGSFYRTFGITVDVQLTAGQTYTLQ